MLRRCFSISFDRTLSSGFADFTGTGRLAEEPGLGLDFTTTSVFLDFIFADGGALTGPPSLRLIESHCSGNRAEKLQGH